MTQPWLTGRVGLGRSVVAARVAELEKTGLIVQDGLAASTGGRAARLLRLRPDAGSVVAVDLGATSIAVGIADLHGRILARRAEEADIGAGPQEVLGRVEKLADELRRDLGNAPPVWGVGVGVPGPVEFETGLPIAPPIMPGWDGHPIRDRLSERFRAPVWVDNDVNLLAIGELRGNPAAAQAGDMLYVKIGTGIGAGLMSRGRLHRGANGCAGDIGHVAAAEAEGVVCRCGNIGCLEAVAGGAALAQDGRRLAESGASPLLAERLAATGRVRAQDVVAAADRGDAAARALLTRASRLVGATLATLVSFYNPRLVVLGGGVVAGGDHVLAALRESVYRRSLPLATRTLRIETTRLGDAAGISGAAHLVLDELFDVGRLVRWLPQGSPVGLPEIAAVPDLS
ncbi:ROK family protein [Actinocorallia aurea]